MPLSCKEVRELCFLNKINLIMSKTFWTLGCVFTFSEKEYQVFLSCESPSVGEYINAVFVPVSTL